MDRLASEENPWKYGIKFRVKFSRDDLGCAAGTNVACEMVRDTEFAIHLESDFQHLKTDESGEDRLWLRHAAEFMQESGGNYLYLRRMVNEQEMMAHWWSQWMGKIKEDRGRYLYCPDFWWTNNPALRRNKAIYDIGTLPLDVSKDGPKGTEGWSKPELTTKAPGNAWIHKWGLFVHDKPSHGDVFTQKGCSPAGCQYGFFKNGSGKFCECCDRFSGFVGMRSHEMRFREALANAG